MVWIREVADLVGLMAIDVDLVSIPGRMHTRVNDLGRLS